jgi:hypothetical protein
VRGAVKRQRAIDDIKTPRDYQDALIAAKGRMAYAKAHRMAHTVLAR